MHQRRRRPKRQYCIPYPTAISPNAAARRKPMGAIALPPEVYHLNRLHQFLNTRHASAQIFLFDVQTDSRSRITCRTRPDKCSGHRQAKL